MRSCPKRAYIRACFCAVPTVFYVPDLLGVCHLLLALWAYSYLCRFISTIGAFHVTSSPPCWWRYTKDRSLARFVCPPAFVHFTIVICVSRDCITFFCLVFSCVLFYSLREMCCYFMTLCLLLLYTAFTLLYLPPGCFLVRRVWSYHSALASPRAVPVG